MTYCCSNKCSKKYKCALWHGNAPKSEAVVVENFHEFGHCIISNTNIKEE